MMERIPIAEALRQYLDGQRAETDKLVMTSQAETLLARRSLMHQSLLQRGSLPGLPKDLGTCDVQIRQGLGARVYFPRCNMKTRATLVYLHGGGWVVGSIETHDPFCRLLCQAGDLIIISVDYGLAPENPFPAALQDSIAAIEWASVNVREWGGDPARLAIGGDSAGANLAAVTANHIASTPSAPSLRAQLLLYPVTDHPQAGHASYTQNGTGFGLDSQLMRWFWDQYAPAVAPDNPDVAPLRLLHIPALPPTLVATAEYDVLRDEGIAYAQRLKNAGIDVTHLHAADMNHNFPVHPGTVTRFPQCDIAMVCFGDWLRAKLA